LAKSCRRKNQLPVSNGLDWLAGERVPMNDETRRRLRDAIKRLIAATSREPTVEEIAKEAQVPVEEVRRVLKVTSLPPSIEPPNEG